MGVVSPTSEVADAVLLVFSVDVFFTKVVPVSLVSEISGAVCLLAFSVDVFSPEVGIVSPVSKQ